MATKVRGLRRTLFVAVAAAIGLAACGGDDPADSGPSPTDADGDQVEGPPVTLTLGHGFPAEHPMQVNMLDPFIEALHDRTGGSVTIELHPAGALSPAPAVYENVVGGAMDMGWSLHGYTAGRFPLIQIVELPFVFDSSEQATDALWHIYEQVPALQEEFSDVKVLALWTHDIGDLWTRGTPVRTLEDFSGLTLRAPGPLQNALINALGAAPVNMPAPEIFDSLERGVIDGLMIANSGLASFNLFDTLAHGTKCNCYVAPMFLVMELSAWESLSPDQQAVIDSLAGRELSLTGARAYDVAYGRVDQRLAESDIEVYELPDDERARWREAAQPVIDGWIADREAEGLPGQQMFDLLQSFLAS